MFLPLYITNLDKTTTSELFYKRSFFRTDYAINSNTTKLQKLIINNIDHSNETHIDNFNNYFQKNQLIRKILHNYWTEYMYITSYALFNNSKDDSITRNYLVETSNSLNSFQSSINVKKYLISNKIQVIGSSNLYSFSHPLSVKYLYRQPFHQIYKKLLSIWQSGLQQYSLKRRMNHYSFEILKKQKFPVFVVANGINEMIIGEPEHFLKIPKSFLKKFLRFEGAKVRPKGIYQLPPKEGYVFINPLDAVEYCHYWQSKYPYSSNELKMKIFIGTLEEFYPRSQIHFHETQLYLLPDLEEIGKLTTKYRQNSNVSFYSKQVHGKSYFQGQPIYFIQPILCKYVDKLTGKTSQRYFPNLLDMKQKDYSSIFTTYQDALSTWAKYRKKFSGYTLPKKPKLNVYNLENFLENYCTQISEDIASNMLFRLVPSAETYQYIKNINTISMNSNNNIFAQFTLLAKIWTNRILWGMIKWYPPR